MIDQNSQTAPAPKVENVTCPACEAVGPWLTQVISDAVGANGKETEVRFYKCGNKECAEEWAE